MFLNLDIFSKVFDKFFNQYRLDINTYNFSFFKSSYCRHVQSTGACVFDYNFLMSLDEKDYSKYLSQAYFIKTGKKLNLRKPKTINEKIQWLKIYDNLAIKTLLTDKVLVRDWIKEKISDEYLKSVLWVGKSFDSIPFDSLPNFLLLSLITVVSGILL